MDFKFKTISQFNDHFKDEKTCYSFLEQQRWGNEIACPHCGSTKKAYNVKPRGKFTDIPSYRCSEKECDLPFTVRTGSIFEGSRVELRKWFQAIYEISISKKGISSVELALRIDVSQKTAWFMNHRLREMLKETSPELLTGEVEVDETYVGGLEKNKHRNKRRAKGTTGSKGKAPMIGLLQRQGKVVLRVVGTDQANAKHIKPIVRGSVDKEATILTDGFGAYRGLDKEFAFHGVVRHDQGEYVNGTVHTNNIEGFWSILKRGIVGTFHVVSHKHLQRYCDEFSYRYNTREVSSSERFFESIANFDNARLTYKELTA